MSEEKQYSKSSKVVDKYRMTMGKLKRVNEDNMNKTLDLKNHNDERFSKRDFQYAEVKQEKK